MKKRNYKSDPHPLLEYSLLSMSEIKDKYQMPQQVNFVIIGNDEDLN